MRVSISKLAVFLFGCGVLLTSATPQTPAQNLFIASATNNTVDEYTASGAFVRHFVAAGSGGLTVPYYIRFGPDGNLYVDSTNYPSENGTVKKYDGLTGAYLGTLPGTSLTPFLFDTAGHLYGTAWGSPDIAGEYDLKSGKMIQSFSTQLSRPSGIAFLPNGHWLVPNAYSTYGNTITEIDPVTGAASTFATGLSEPWSIIEGPDGRYYIANGAFNGGPAPNSVSVLDASGGVATQFNVGGSMLGPNDLTFNSDGNLYVVSYYDSEVSVFDGTTGDFLLTFPVSADPTSITTHPPALTALSPASMDAGAGGFTLKAKGGYFQPNSVVTWTAVGTTTSLATSYVSADLLQAAVPSSLIANAGNASVSVVTSGPGGGVSVLKSFTILGTILKLTNAQMSTDANGNYVATLTLKNSGYQTASTVQITKSSLGTANPSTSLPVSVGDIAAGATGTVTLTYPSSAGVPGSKVTLKVSGTFTGGMFSGSVKDTLP